MQAPEHYPFIPLRRGGSPEGTAASVLLYVSYVITCATDCMSTAWLRLLLLMLWKLQVVLVSKKKRTYQSFVCTTLPRVSEHVERVSIIKYTPNLNKR